MTLVKTLEQQKQDRQDRLYGTIPLILAIISIICGTVAICIFMFKTFIYN